MHGGMSPGKRHHTEISRSEYLLSFCACKCETFPIGKSRSLTGGECLWTVTFPGRSLTHHFPSLTFTAPGPSETTFAGSTAPFSSNRAAIVYSLLGIAKLNNLNPEAYLRTVFASIADYPVKKVADLLPWNLANTSSS